ncbi:hypothetical protein [Desulfonatronovibrio magnus]|uniref:hypothetical protein n=1 Tax=Desulfonatronovibrio magnus TaxID=698827 RepID=UPI0005EBDBBE|nr:hypothetical protein [Desulfonatronovibrio magnus]
MDNKIFKLGLSVEAVSLYLILFDLDFSKVPLERENIESRWNAASKLLDKALEELEMNNVVSRKGEAILINPSAAWTETGTA